MTDSSELIQKADELKQQAAHEDDPAIRARLLRMAERYIHLAQSQKWSKEHPPSAAGLAEVLVGEDKS